MNQDILEKAKDSLSGLSSDFYEGRISKVEFESLAKFPKAILERAKEKKKYEVLKATPNMSDEAHKNLWELQQKQDEEKLASSEKSEDELEVLVGLAKKEKNVYQEIAEMDTTAHKALWSKFQAEKSF